MHIEYGHRTLEMQKVTNDYTMLALANITRSISRCCFVFNIVPTFTKEEPIILPNDGANNRKLQPVIRRHHDTSFAEDSLELSIGCRDILILSNLVLSKQVCHGRSTISSPVPFVIAFIRHSQTPLIALKLIFRSMSTPDGSRLRPLVLNNCVL